MFDRIDQVPVNLNNPIYFEKYSRLYQIPFIRGTRSKNYNTDITCRKFNTRIAVSGHFVRYYMNIFRVKKEIFL